MALAAVIEAVERSERTLTMSNPEAVVEEVAEFLVDRNVTVRAETTSGRPSGFVVLDLDGRSPPLRCERRRPRTWFHPRQPSRARRRRR